KKQAGSGPEPIELVENPDILAELVTDRPREGLVVVGFAAETGDETASVLEHGRAKARREGADPPAANDVSGGPRLGSAENTVTLLDAAGETVELPGRGSAIVSGSKREVAEALLDAVLTKLR